MGSIEYSNEILSPKKRYYIISDMSVLKSK